MSFAIPGDPDEDRLLFPDDEHLLLIGGYDEASDAMLGAGGSGDSGRLGNVVSYVIAP